MTLLHKKTPTKILEMRGSWRAKTRTKEPQPPPLALTAPEWLDDEGKQLWTQLTPSLVACGILTVIDEQAFGRYCAFLVHWIAMQQFLQEHGEVDEEGNLWSQTTLSLRLSDHLLKLEQQFGLTPASRPNVPRREVPPHGNAKSRFFIDG